MPAYDYECQLCGYKLEVFHSMSAIPLTTCPECGQSTLIKLIGMGAAVIVKGTNTPCRGGRSIKSQETKDRLGEGKNKMTQKPFWRNEKINKKILKNPRKYISDGEV